MCRYVGTMYICMDKHDHISPYCTYLVPFSGALGVADCMYVHTMYSRVCPVVSHRYLSMPKKKFTFHVTIIYTHYCIHTYTPSLLPRYVYIHHVECPCANYLRDTPPPIHPPLFFSPNTTIGVRVGIYRSTYIRRSVQHARHIFYMPRTLRFFLVEGVGGLI